MSSAPSNPAPLAGTRVVDLSSYTPGPLCASLLAELGADVTKVERPTGGDPGRAVTPGTYQVLNRCKQVVRADLTTSDGQLMVRELADEADVLVQAFRPGTADRLGIGAAALIGRNPRLVHCAINGYGSASPAAAHDLDVAARTGLLWLSGDPGQQPMWAGRVPHVDVATAHFALAAILAALLRRERMGTGARLEVPMAAAALKLAEFRLADHAVWDAHPSGGPASNPTYRTVRAADGRFIALACMSDRDWDRLVAVLDTPSLRDIRLGTAAGRRQHRERIRQDLDLAFDARPAAEWAARLEVAGVPAALVNEPADIPSDPVIAALDVLRRPVTSAPVGVDFPVRGLGLGPDADRPR